MKAHATLISLQYKSKIQQPTSSGCHRHTKEIPAEYARRLFSNQKRFNLFKVAVFKCCWFLIHVEREKNTRTPLPSLRSLQKTSCLLLFTVAGDLDQCSRFLICRLVAKFNSAVALLANVSRI